MMNLEHRLQSLEKRLNSDNPFAHWTEAQPVERMASLWGGLSDAGKAEVIALAWQRGITLTENGELVS